MSRGLEPALVPLRENERALLVEDFERLRPHGRRLPESVLTYVIDGSGADVLEVLSGIKDSLQGLRLGSWFHPAEKSPRREFFRTLETRNAPLLMRLAKVYEAAARTAPFQRQPNANPEGAWLRAFVVEARQFTVSMWPPQSQECPALDAVLIEEMLRADERDPDVLVRAAIFLELGRGMEREALFATIPGFAESCLRHLHVVREALADADVERRLHALKVLDRYGVDGSALVPELVAQGVGEGKKAREAAQVLLGKAGGSVVPELEKAAGSRRASEREHALVLIARLGGRAARPLLAARLDAEKDKRMRSVISDLLASLPPDPPAPGRARSAPVAVVAPLEDEVQAALGACLDALDRLHEAVRQRAPKANVPAAVEAETRAAAFRALHEMVPGEEAGGPPLLRALFHDREVREAIGRFLDHPSLLPIHAVRALILFGVLVPGSRYEETYGFVREVDMLLTRYRKSHSPALTLSDLAAVFGALDLDDRRIGRYYLGCLRYDGKPFAWGDDAVWPYFAERVDLIEKAFTPGSDYRRRVERAAAFGVLRMFPSPPPTLHATLWVLALGPGKKERVLAQACLEQAADRTRKTIDALDSRKAETRTVAAEWLGRQADHAAIEALARALAVETHESARGAMLSALEALGASVEPYVARDVLEREAREGLAISSKGRSALRWLPLAKLPPVHWEDTGEPVSVHVLEWLVLQSHKLASPEAGPLLRRHAAAFRALDRKALGLFILENWIHEDLDRGSAIGDRGILAVAAACGDRSAVPIVSRYVREQYGTRMGQCKALLQMLAWIDDPASVQFLVSVATRFRTKGIQAEAKRLTENLAEEHGWSVEDLADRSVATAGLGADGCLTLDYGSRKFIARIGGDGLVLRAEDGQVIPSLPVPRKSDQPEKAAQAKKALEEARRELKTTLQLQKSRLYEALCAQRTWALADWDAYLNRHPIVGPYCRRLAWTVAREGPPAVFRPLDDGSLSDHEDRPLAVGAGERVKLAHASVLEPAVCVAWARHFADYEVSPLFDQFSQPTYRLQDAAKDDTEIAEFLGHMLPAAALRGQALARGYERGPFEGHMWFQMYRKRFDGLALEAVVHFSGTRPDEDHPVALRTLSFARLELERKSEQPGERVSLGDVPPVLLSECWNDVRSIAAVGSGFDADWMKKVGW